MSDFYGQNGWKEFLVNRQNILSEYDKILQQIQNRPVKVAHGIGIEAYLRKWFAEFLPKKFGVTSGYIIPNLYTDSVKIYHYDIIIYNQLESPILWTEGNEDNSDQGKYRAIPAKYVVAIYEVKSRLTKHNISQSFEKLNQVKNFTDQLPVNFSCGLIFIELMKKDVNQKMIIKELAKGADIFKFSGGMILRYEEDHTTTGLIKLLSRQKNVEVNNERLSPLAKPIDDLNIYSTEEGNIVIREPGAGITLVKTAENTFHLSVIYGVLYDSKTHSTYLSWSRSHFSDFCIDLLGSLEGLAVNDQKRLSFGRVFDEVKRINTPLQSDKLEKGKPFLNLKLYDGDDPNLKLKISQENGKNILTYYILLENHGDSEVVFSEDYFKTEFKLPGKMITGTSCSYEVRMENPNVDILTVLEKDNCTIPFRLVYYETKSEKDFFAIEKRIMIREGQAVLLDN